MRDSPQPFQNQTRRNSVGISVSPFVVCSARGLHFRLKLCYRGALILTSVSKK